MSHKDREVIQTPEMLIQNDLHAIHATPSLMRGFITELLISAICYFLHLDKAIIKCPKGSVQKLF